MKQRYVLDLQGLHNPAMLQHATVLHQLTSLLMANMHYADQKDEAAETAMQNDFHSQSIFVGAQHTNRQPIESRLDLLSPLTNLRQLRLCAEGDGRDGSMIHLSSLVQLTRLECWYYPLDMVARDLQQLTTLKELRHLAFLGSARGNTELNLDPLQHMAHLTCLELYTGSDRFKVGGWHAVGKPGNVVERLFLREVEVIVPEEPAPQMHWPCLRKLNTRSGPDPLLLSVLQLHSQKYDHKKPPAIDFRHLALGLGGHDPSVYRQAVRALRVLGITSFAFVLKKLDLIRLLAPLGRQLTNLELELDSDTVKNKLTAKQGTALGKALPRLQRLELTGIGSSGGAEALLLALTELKVLDVSGSVAHVKAWRQAVRTVKPPGLAFESKAYRK